MEQFVFSDGVADKLEEAESHLVRAGQNLADGPAKDALQKAQESIKEGKGQLTHQQKFIKAADRSELGWAVVAEYETDALAINRIMSAGWRMLGAALLEACFNFWVQELSASQWIVNMTKNGHTFPLFVKPSLYRKVNPSSA